LEKYDAKNKNNVLFYGSNFHSVYLRYFLDIMSGWPKEKYVSEKNFRFFDIVKIDLSFNLEKFVMILNRNNNLIVKLNNKDNKDNKNTLTIEEMVNENEKGKLINVISNQNFDIFYLNHIPDPEYYSIDDDINRDYSSKSKNYILTSLEVFKLNLKIYTNIFFELCNEDNEIILQKNFNNNNNNENPIYNVVEILGNLTKKLKLLSLIINDISKIDSNNKKYNNFLKILKKTDDHFDIFNVIKHLKDTYFVYLISDINNFVNNISCIFKKNKEIILTSEFLKNVAAITNQNKSLKMVENILCFIDSNVIYNENFDWSYLNNPDFISIFSHVILEYKKFNENTIKNALVILRYVLDFLKKKDLERYKDNIIFLEKNNTNLRIEEMSTIHLGEKINSAVNLILRENWEVADLHLHDVRKLIKNKMK